MNKTKTFYFLCYHYGSLMPEVVEISFRYLSEKDTEERIENEIDNIKKERRRCDKIVVTEPRLTVFKKWT